MTWLIVCPVTVRGRATLSIVMFWSPWLNLGPPPPQAGSTKDVPRTRVTTASVGRRMGAPAFFQASGGSYPGVPALGSPPSAPGATANHGRCAGSRRGPAALEPAVGRGTQACPSGRAGVPPPPLSSATGRPHPADPSTL